MVIGEFKQEILRINNKVNMEVFRQGLLTQRADICGDKVMIVAKNRRVIMLSMFDAEMDRSTIEIMDRLLIAKFKKRFIEVVEEELGIKVLAHFKDYDPDTELSVSVSFFEKPLDELLPGLSVKRSTKNQWQIP